MKPTNSNPLRGLLSAFLLIACLAIGHLLHRLLLPVLFGVLCLFLLAARLWDYLKANRVEVTEALMFGAPFALILLIVAQLKH